MLLVIFVPLTPSQSPDEAPHIAIASSHIVVAAHISCGMHTVSLPNLDEATLTELQDGLSAGFFTSVDLVKVPVSVTDRPRPAPSC